MSKAKKNKNFTLWVYNTLTGLHEEVEVSEEVYRTYKRTQWNIEDNDESYYEHEIQFSGLIGGEDNNYENFHEFVVNTFETDFITKMQLDALQKAVDNLPDEENALIRAIYFEGMSERDYAALLDEPAMTIHDRKVRILKKIKKSL